MSRRGYLREKTVKPQAALCQEALNRGVLLHAGQAHVQALELVREPAVVDAEAVEDGGIHVVDMNRVFDDVVAEVVGLAVDDAPLDAAAGHPHGIAAWMMIPAVVVAG